MVRVRLSIEPDLCGPVSVGTVGVIKVLSERLELSLTKAQDLVGACVFDGQEVELEAASEAVARELIEALAGTQAGPRIRARLAD